jgi:hypothetical protein
VADRTVLNKCVKWCHDTRRNDTQHNDFISRLSLKCHCAECRHVKRHILLLLLHAGILNVVVLSVRARCKQEMYAQLSTYERGLS